jgi:hypothetical protein
MQANSQIRCTMQHALTTPGPFARKHAPLMPTHTTHPPSHRGHSRHRIAHHLLTDTLHPADMRVTTIRVLPHPSTSPSVDNSDKELQPSSLPLRQPPRQSRITLAPFSRSRQHTWQHPTHHGNPCPAFRSDHPPHPRHAILSALIYSSTID